MRRFGWVVGLGPPLVLAAIGVVAPQGLVAGATKTGCPAAFAVRGQQVDAQVSLATVLGRQGEVTGRRLTVSVGVASRTISLAAEAFVSQPVANVVVYGQNDPVSGSTVRAMDLQTGCDYALWQSTDVVRSALIAPDLHALYAHLVGAANRADRGVVRVDPQTGATTNVVPPLAADPDFGLTFSTKLRWSLDDDSLAVQSCGLGRCRMRIFDTATAAVMAYAAGNQGDLVGLTSTGVVAFDACPNLPCGLSWIDRQTGRSSAIDVDALSASLGEDSAGPVLSVTTPAGTREIRP